MLRTGAFVGYGDAVAYTQRLPLLRAALQAPGGGPWVARPASLGAVTLRDNRDLFLRSRGRS